MEDVVAALAEKVWLQLQHHFFIGMIDFGWWLGSGEDALENGFQPLKTQNRSPSSRITFHLSPLSTFLMLHVECYPSSNLLELGVALA